jgi:methionyl-tRNA formyltransferase
LSWDALETRLAEAGARLLAETLRADPPGRPQPPEGASQQGLPRSRDLELPTSWTARRAFNLIRGAAEWGPFTITAGGVRIVVREAKDFSPEAGEAGTVRRTKGGTEVGFSPGTVLFLDPDLTPRLGASA